uniref:Uncharacterized protein n=1 Tax=Rhipicephalus microplus TaxID=6941 RepID=G0WS02_RHIMP|nr:hypothetical protein E3G_000004 [Rhipicephalus microplus]
MVKKTVKCSGCGVGSKVDPSVEAEGEEVDAKCRQCEVKEKMEKMMVTQNDVPMRITELESALATEQEKTRATGEKLKSAKEAPAKVNRGAAYGDNSREPATRTAEKTRQFGKNRFSWFICRKAQLQRNSGGLNDVLNEDAARLATTLAKGVDDMRPTSPQVQVAICTIPEVPVRERNLQRTVVNANKEIWRMSREKGFEVVEINRQVHRWGAFQRDRIHFDGRLGHEVGWRLAGRTVAF